MKSKFYENELNLVRLCKKGNAKAQYKLYKLYSVAMYNIAIRMTSNQGIAEDIVQDSFIKAFTDIKKLKDEKAFSGWLKRIVINRCIDTTRKQKIIYTDIETLKYEHHEIAEEVESTVKPEMLHYLIKKLPEGARQILVLHALEGFKHAEIGEKLGISESTAKTQFFRAKQLLAKMLTGKDYETKSGKIPERKTIEA